MYAVDWRSYQDLYGCQYRKLRVIVLVRSKTTQNVHLELTFEWCRSRGCCRCCYCCCCCCCLHFGVLSANDLIFLYNRKTVSLKSKASSKSSLHCLFCFIYKERRDRKNGKKIYRPFCCLSSVGYVITSSRFHVPRVVTHHQE